MVKRTCGTTLLVVFGFLAALHVSVAAADDEKQAEKAASDANGAQALDLKGNWLGTMDAGVIKLRLGFVVQAAKDGALEAKLFSVDQGNVAIPVSAVEVKDGQVSLVVKAVAGRFDGKWNAQTGEIVGEWKQGPQSFPLTLKKVDVLPGVNRPQEPKKPYPYREEEVSFQNAKHNVTVNGTLTVPNGQGPFPAVVLISGSGAQDRNEELMGHRPFHVLADALTRPSGIAVLRYDDRDFNDPKLAFQVTFADHGEDAYAGVKFLQSRPEIRSNRIGLVGHSEGGIAAPLIASREKDIAFVVLIAGTGIPGDQIHSRQTEQVLERLGLNEAQLKTQREGMQKMYQVLKEEPDNVVAEKKLTAIARESRPNGSEPESEAAMAAFKAQVKPLLTPWFRYFISYDPRPALTKLTCPVLAIVGEKDVQVLARENLAIIEEALKEGGNRDFVVKELPGLNHLLQPCTTGRVDEYSLIETTIDPAALTLICDWVVDHAAK